MGFSCLIIMAIIYVPHLQAATRGDGAVGDDVTHNAPTIMGIPLDISSSGSSVAPGSAEGTAGGNKLPRLLEVRGEVYMRHEDLMQVCNVHIRFEWTSSPQIYI